MTKTKKNLLAISFHFIFIGGKFSISTDRHYSSHNIVHLFFGSRIACNLLCFNYRWSEAIITEEYRYRNDPNYCGCFTTMDWELHSSKRSESILAIEKNQNLIQEFLMNNLISKVLYLFFFVQQKQIFWVHRMMIECWMNGKL